ncbi:conserved hypothetical protein [Mycoavidus cysteinexigens]|uniref:Uncharacterized protein n=1 Tax=Mycoavidus cysteinexigens TaxID=1553431 RepID=A0A2Z6EXG4_9BURK|nr:ATP-binding protein [Mycoavidus cysteinexigens]BBE10153.1 conserved hypothetical protein [Mycoavidus cysteinexigens]GLR00570.1 hypothetical protein GCM10007934_03810 [Mycoavidus cysteinexigens]
MLIQFTYKRPALAHSLCDSLMGVGIANSRSGLFLAGPRRVGKSTFLNEDLIPQAQARQWIPIYVDLWSDKNTNPATLIAEAIKTKIASFDGIIARLAKAAKLDKVTVMGTLILDFKQSGLPPNTTLADALRILHHITKQPIVLIVDEAQCALTTEAGLNAMFALKSARDQLNSGDGIPTLMLVFTGSNQDKLAHLVLKKEQPFFGSDVIQFPLLDKGFTDAFTNWVNQSLSQNNQFTQEGMWAAFKLAGYRPEILRQLAGKIALSGNAAGFADLLSQNAEIWHERIWEEFESDFNVLTSLQQAILEIMVHKGRAWLPYSESSMASYRQLSKQPALTIASVQTAIQSLRERGFIWQSGRGAYALEDDSFAEWFRHNRKPISDSVQSS